MFLSHIQFVFFDAENFGLFLENHQVQAKKILRISLIL